MANRDNIEGVIKYWAKVRPDDVALRFLKSNRDYDFAALAEAVSEICSSLEGVGIGEGHVVEIIVDDAERTALYLLALLTMGAIPLTADPTSNVERLTELTGVVSPVAIIMDAEDTTSSQLCEVSGGYGVAAIGNKKSEVVLVKKEEWEESGLKSSILMPTSGSTGESKIVQISLRSIIHNATEICNYLEIGTRDRFLSLTSLCYCHGFYNGVLMPLVAGAGTVVMDKFSIFGAAKIWHIIENNEVTVVNIVPTMIDMMLKVKYSTYVRPESLRFMICGTALLPEDIKRSFESAYDIPIFTQYGMTESLINTVNKVSNKPGSQGRAVGCTLTIRDAQNQIIPCGEVGEISIQGDPVTTGFYMNQDLTRKAIVDGWLRSGDLGYLDADNYLYVVGRAKEVINKGGAKIYPDEINEVFKRHPDVEESCSVGVPDPAYGENVCVFLVMRAGKGTSVQKMYRYARSRFPKFKVPGNIMIVNAIPKGPTGKPRLARLKEMASCNASCMREAYAQPRQRQRDVSIE